MKSLLKTLTCFIIAVLLLPVIVLSFICVHIGNELTNYVLSIKYPNLTVSNSKKIRTLIDTPKNAGIFHFLLQVRGACDFDRIRQQYEQQLIELRDKTGWLRFPKLRQQLVTCWGQYAWVNDTSGFNINNHVLLSTHKYRGRHVNDENIEEYISELSQKYIPSDLPQWQVVIIPIMPTNNADIRNLSESQEEHYYILVKVHHLIIAEEEDLHVSEMLLLRDPERRTMLDIDDVKLQDQSQAAHQLSHFVRKPEHIQKLFQYIFRQIVCRWQKFIYEFESLEHPDGCTQVYVSSATQLLSVILLILANVCFGYRRTMELRKKLQRRSSSYRNHVGRWQTFQALLRKELIQRQLNWNVAVAAIKNSWQPGHVAKCLILFIWRLQVNNVMLMPYHCYVELLSLRDLLLRGQTQYSQTYCARVYTYVPLLIYAQLEFFKICFEVFKAPRNIFEVLFEQPTRESNILHKKSYSGRKVVSFTKSIDGRALRLRNHFCSEVLESDFALTCLAGAVHDYINSFATDTAVPNMVNTTCRTVSKGYFTEHLGGKSDHIGGVVFLQLPLKVPGLNEILLMHSNIEKIREQQIMLYLASMGQTKYNLLTALMPQVLTKICINFFSYNFPITITEIYGANAEFKTYWGQKVDDVLLFRPPQSKTCLSLNLHRFGDKYRLAIMADTQLAPNHSKIARAFEHYMETIILKNRKNL